MENGTVEPAMFPSHCIGGKAPLTYLCWLQLNVVVPEGLDDALGLVNNLGETLGDRIDIIRLEKG